MKIYSLFLPQFHEIEENNKWWGKGFTEWVNVKKATPLFKGHMQPLVPYDSNYYNLLDKNTVIWQTELMKKYGIDGFIYYHYYFKGKKLLEKPAENLLKWTDIDQEFFFNWANHSWVRSWNGSKELLIEQTYGNKEDWRRHFEYLLPFFKDKRYKKIDNMPVFVIYNHDFTEKDEMFECFNSWCIDEGFGGLYLIDEIWSYDQLDKKCNKGKIVKKNYVTQPLAGRMKIYDSYSFVRKLVTSIFSWMIQKGLIKKVVSYNGNKIYDILMTCKNEPDLVQGLFFEWDNTPRHGYRGYVITPPDKQKFFEYMDYIQECEMVFVNAWNEWCEGMVLEPSEQNGYKYLEWIREWKTKNKP